MSLKLKPFAQKGWYGVPPRVVMIMSEYDCSTVYPKDGLTELSTNVKGVWFYSE
jgi:hypothetical protein